MTRGQIASEMQSKEREAPQLNETARPGSRAVCEDTSGPLRRSIFMCCHSSQGPVSQQAQREAEARATARSSLRIWERDPPVQFSSLR
ncbi:hypothetical protein NDU88_002152 [Pleurodeles waltl]|uniref:Uncharacterized protein n=1 Tax=Pleurodeles waltl TaxID=8319 RepID=A0AAV7W1C9_PLEWA|nr:hypothetical protein NDU88_002152 [Pleurodeles waltl]